MHTLFFAFWFGGARTGKGAQAAIDLDGQFALHPTLAPLKEIYDERDLAIVHATGLTSATRSHFDAMRFMEYGTPDNKTVGTGWIGRHLHKLAVCAMGRTSCQLV